MDPLRNIGTRNPATPQTEQADPRQIRNAAGGFAFAVTEEVRVRRFLTLGTDGGTYYATERAVTQANAEVILRAARDRAVWLVNEILTISTAGRAPRQQPALFALAAAAGLGDEAGRRAALASLPLVARTGSHLFLFAGYVQQFRGWGRALRNAIGDWYMLKGVDDLAYQALKYRQREGWTHRDLLRLSHPLIGEAKTTAPAHRELFEWIARGGESTIPLVSAFQSAQSATRATDWVRLITEQPLSWEMLPDAALAEPTVWEALIAKGMPQTALIRQLPRLTRLGLFSSSSPALRIVTGQLTNEHLLRKGRVHPINVLVAQRTYASGVSARGTGTWTPARQIVDALDAAYYASFKTITPTGKRTLLALDVSGSMGSPVSGLPITCREASAALALATMAAEPDADVTVVGFTSTTGRSSLTNSGLTELTISPRQRLDDAVAQISRLPFGGTDCSLPFTWATAQKATFDTFVVYTDNETWAGRSHPDQALKRYRERMGIDAKLVVVGLTASEVSIADPTDPGMLDVAGFDSAVPNLISDFSRGEI